MEEGHSPMRGWLLKWTNYARGYQGKWFVLQDGNLSYYSNQSEMAHTRKGRISLNGAHIHMEDACTFVLSNGGTNIIFRIKTTSMGECESWVAALKLAGAKAVHAMGDPATTQSDSIRKELHVKMEGWLLKWTNYFKGYQRRWFVLQYGHLFYYRSEAEPTKHVCQGRISMSGALINTASSCNFVISDGNAQTIHIKAASEIERQSWITALELAGARSV